MYNKTTQPKLPDEFNSSGEKHTDVFIPSGENKKSKVRDFVNKNCSKSVSEVFDKSYEYAISRNIKPEIVYAIALADTGCGKNLTTKNNITNISNNDRGNRRGFNSVYDAWVASVNALDNKWMGKNRTIADLSNGGKKKTGSKYSCRTAPVGFKCWATSEYNWHKNTTRALRSMSLTNENNFDNVEIRLSN